MLLLQAEVVAHEVFNTQLRGANLVIVCITFLSLGFMFIFGRYYFGNSGKNILTKIGKETIDKLVKEKEMVIDESNAIMKTVCDNINKINEAIKEHDVFSHNTLERFEAIAIQMEEHRKSDEEWHLRILRSSILDERNAPLLRMIDLIEYIKRAANGYVLELALKNLILPRPELWYSLNCNPEDLSGVRDIENYKNTMLEIKRRLNSQEY